MFNLNKLSKALLFVWIMIAQSNGGFSAFPMPSQKVCDEKVTWAVEQGANGATCYIDEDPIYTTDPSLTTTIQEPPISGERSGIIFDR